MGTNAAARARRRAYGILAYRAWAADPSQAPVPPIGILSDPSIHRFEANRELRLAQNGIFRTPAVAGIASAATA